MSPFTPPLTDDDDARSTSSSSQSSSKGYETKLARKLRTVEPERAVRLAARAARNRVSAQKSRDRKKRHMSELESESNQLRAEKAELEERVRTLEDLVKTLLMNQTSIRNCQVDPLSIAAPRENETVLPKEKASFSQPQQSSTNSNALTPPNVHINQSLESESHACLPAAEDSPAAGMDSIMADDVLKEYAIGLESFSLNGSSVDTTDLLSLNSENESSPLSSRSSTSSILADENSWIMQCLESSVTFNSETNMGHGNGQGECANQVWGDHVSPLWIA